MPIVRLFASLSPLCTGSSLTSDLDISKQVDTAGWISVAILPLCVFLLVSYAVLPVKWTHRHYLSICFTVGIVCIQVSPIEWQPRGEMLIQARSHSSFRSAQDLTNVIMLLLRRTCIVIYHAPFRDLFYFLEAGWQWCGVRISQSSQGLS